MQQMYDDAQCLSLQQDNKIVQLQADHQQLADALTKGSDEASLYLKLVLETISFKLTEDVRLAERIMDFKVQQKLSRFEGYRERRQQKEATAKPEGPYWEMPVEQAPRSMQIDEEGAPDIEMNEIVESSCSGLACRATTTRMQVHVFMFTFMFMFMHVHVHVQTSMCNARAGLPAGPRRPRPGRTRRLLCGGGSGRDAAAPVGPHPAKPASLAAP